MVPDWAGIMHIASNTSTVTLDISLDFIVDSAVPFGVAARTLQSLRRY